MLTTVLVILSIVVDIGIGAKAMTKYSDLNQKFTNHEVEDRMGFASIHAKLDTLKGS